MCLLCSLNALIREQYSLNFWCSTSLRVIGISTLTHLKLCNGTIQYLPYKHYNDSAYLIVSHVQASSSLLTAPIGTGTPPLGTTVPRSYTSVVTPPHAQRGHVQPSSSLPTLTSPHLLAPLHAMPSPSMVMLLIAIWEGPKLSFFSSNFIRSLWFCSYCIHIRFHPMPSIFVLGMYCCTIFCIVLLSTKYSNAML